MEGCRDYTGICEGLQGTGPNGFKKLTLRYNDSMYGLNLLSTAVSCKTGTETMNMRVRRNYQSFSIYPGSESKAKVEDDHHRCLLMDGI